MTRRIIPVADWAPAQEAMYSEPSSSFSPSRGNPVLYEPVMPSYEARPRAINFSLLRRRPKSLVIESSDTNMAVPFLERHSHIRSESAFVGHSHASKPESSSSLRGIIRRASTSLRVKLHRRPTLTNSSISEEPYLEARPATAHATWHRLRQAASFRQQRPVYGESNEPPNHQLDHLTEAMAALPVPSIGGEPPIIPHNTGAAAKASVAEYLNLSGASSSDQESVSHGLRNKWLAHVPGEECGNDRESGIGITVAGSVSEADLTDSKRASLRTQDGTISRIDFITQLPTELAIQILSHLDASGLMTASQVSWDWRAAVANQHVWRESFLREKTATYATSGPIKPGAGLGVPTVKPSNNWREIYCAREELDRRWKRGEAKPVYLNGHLDSIYCLQFDEYVFALPRRPRTARFPVANDSIDLKSSQAQGTRPSGYGTCTPTSASLLSDLLRS